MAKFGPINLYIASIVLPILIIHLWKLSLNNRELHAIGLSLITLIILLIHPDAGQLTAFACATAIIFWKSISHLILKIFIYCICTCHGNLIVGITR